jgi:hypothetical protein
MAAMMMVKLERIQLLLQQVFAVTLLNKTLTQTYRSQ